MLLAAAVAWSIAGLLAGAAERQTQEDLTSALNGAGLGWVEFQVDGLTAHLTGRAPGESARLAALRVAAGVVGAGGLTEEIDLPRSQAAVAPVFRIEAMRNGADLSLIGLVPASMGAETLAARLTARVPGVELADMLQSADHPEPPGWGAAVDFAAEALNRMPVAQVSVSAGRIEVSALVDSPEARRALETELRGMAPRGQVLTLDLVAPRPVIAPFLFRATRVNGALRLEACAAGTETGRSAIERAARAAGMAARFNCPIGLGVPSPRWPQAVEQGLAALARLPAGTLTLSDLSVRLEAPHDADRAEFDRIVGGLEGALPEGFALSAALLPAPEAAGPAEAARPEFLVVLAQDGRATITGRLPDSRIRQAVGAFARARFGTDSVTIETRMDADLPAGWSTRVLAGLEAMAVLQHGRLTVTDAQLALTGVTGNPEAAAQVTQLLAARLGRADGVALNLTYDEAFDPVAQEPTPDRCETWVRRVLETDKITFAPGSARLDDASRAALDRIAEILRDCGELPFEVAGHTDSQGRAETNQTLSQARAAAVVDALSARAVLVASMVAQGYGADQPIADNGTEAGREANRRIEFTLIRPQVDPAELSPEDRAAQEAELTIAPQTPAEGQTRPALRPVRDDD